MPRKLQAGIHHVQPVGVKPPAGIGIAADLAATIGLPREFQVVLDVVLEVVRVDEVLARVVRRVDVDELDLAGVVLAQELQRVEVVALDVHFWWCPSPCCVP